ncbi:fumarate reductase subunit FrdD [Neisseria dentiae]|uniref:fumarate reductase subunit FrdD n=3 Tax=Neisseria dentiae TaxID=194197 RepID=UPI0035A1AF7F
MMSNKHMKPLYWGIFSAGGTVAAIILAPVLVVLCLLLPFGILGSPAEFYDSVHGFVSNKLVYLVLCAVVFTILWHGVHRFYYILHDMHVHVGNRTRLGFYAFAVLVFVFTLLKGWF